MGAAGSVLSGAAALIGATKKQPSSSASAAAAPTRTPQQAELSQYIMPTLKNWMTDPPKVTRPAWNPTNVNTGAAKSGFTQGAWVTNPEYSTKNAEYLKAKEAFDKQNADWMKQEENLRSANASLGQTRGQARFGAWNQMAVNSKTMEDIGTQRSAAQKKLEELQKLVPEEKSFNSGTLNIANAPTLAPTMGTLGQYQKQNYGNLIDAAAKPMTDRTAQINQFMQGLSVPKALDYQNSLDPLVQQRMMDFDPNLTTPQALDYQNSLDPLVQERMTQNLDRTVQEGFDANYLKDLAAQGLDPLKEAFDQAMKSATADYNRRGMSASGFEFGQKYGTQPDSITKNYLKSVGDVARDVSLRGAEAARADRFTNAGLRDQALAQLANLSQAQSANQLNRLNVDTARQLQEKNMQQQNTAQLADLSQTQNANQLNRLNMDTSRQLQEKNLQQQGLGMLNNQEQQARQLAQQKLTNTMSADQSNEANRQWWANLQGDQQRYDQQNQIADWQRNTDMAMRLADRADQNVMTQIDRGAEDQKTNIGYDQQALTNIMNFINGQQATANNAQQNYWNAAQIQQQQQQQQQAQQLQALQGLGGLFAKQAPVQTTVPTQAITPQQFQGYQQAGGNFMSGLQNTMAPATNYLTNFYNAFGG